ncbi:MAG: hypothetical protein IJI73_08350, partial [Kiritimatiellae bacterium]|nr:hypothetical protein [Kiritimatiellia bacterium]
LADVAKVKPAAANASGAAVWRVDVAVPDPDPTRAVAITGLGGYGVADIYPDENGFIHLWLPDGTYDFEVDGTPVHEEVDGASIFIPLGVAVDGVDVGQGSGPNWTLDAEKRIVLTGACVVSGTNTVDGLSIRIETSEQIVFSNACVRSGTGLKVAAGTNAVVRGIGRNVVAPTFYSNYLEGGASLAVAGGTFEFGNYDPLAILGGSVTGLGTYYGSPTNAAGATVWKADIVGFAPGEAVGPLQGLPDYYDTDEIYADDNGEVHLWLPEGTYVATNAADGAKWTIRIGSKKDDTTVVAWNDDFTVNGVNIAELSGDGWDYSTNVLTLAGIDRYTLRGTNTLGGVQVFVAADATVELSGVSLSSRKPLALGSGVTATVLLSGHGNRLVAINSSNAALYVPEGASVTITNATADARLFAQGSDYGAGIGDDHGNTRPGAITIAGGFVEAYSGEGGKGYGAGIGAGADGKSSRLIRITGGRVFAYGGVGNERAGAAIGGSATYTDSDGRIEISGGTVHACGGFMNDAVFAADIGDGTSHGAAYENANAVVITGGSVVLAHFDGEKTRFTQSNCAVTNLAHDATGRVLHAVIVPLGDAGTAVEISGLAGYGARDLYADAGGDLCLWLPDGDYRFTANGRGYTAAVDGADTVAVADAIALEAIRIESVELVPGSVKLVVSAEPADWLTAETVQQLRVRAADGLPMPGGDAALLPREDVGVMVNPDGTATLAVPRTDVPARFFRVETE